MRGRRCSELACGEAQRFIREMCELESARLHPHMAALQAADRADKGAQLFDDFSVDKAFVLAEWQVRASCFTRLPLKLLCIGHQDITVARTHLAICLVMAHQLDPDECHPLVRKWLCRPSADRDTLLQFLRGTPIQELPELHMLRCQARFASNLEIGIERRHAQMHHCLQTARHHSEAYASISMRKREILQEMESSDAFPTVLATLLDRCGSERAVAEVPKANSCRKEAVESGLLRMRVQDSCCFCFLVAQLM